MLRDLNKGVKRNIMQSSRSGDTTTPIIMWIGVFLAITIIVTWFMLHLRPLQQDAENTRNDLNRIKESIGIACSSMDYQKLYNPITSRGIFIANNSQACINSSSYTCIELPCQVPAISADLEKTIYLHITKNSTGLYIGVDS